MHNDLAPETQSTEIEGVYGDGLPFDLDRIRDRILDAGARILEDMVQVGKYLIWAKAELGHGAFTKFVEHDLNISPVRAREFMRIAQRTIHSESPHTRKFLTQTSSGSKHKMLALLDVSDEEMEEAVAEDAFLGRPLDEIEAMSVRELRSALKSSRVQAQRQSARADREAERALGAEAKLSRSSRDLSITEMPTAALGAAIIALSECKQDLMLWAEDPYTHEQGATSNPQALLNTIEATVRDIRVICTTIDHPQLDAD